jgi:serine/threonine protein phosphatase PrpC
MLRIMRCLPGEELRVTRRATYAAPARSAIKPPEVYLRSGVRERPLQIEHAELSLLGNREENQDRVAVVADGGEALLAVVDGMGGHADGARAAEAAIRAMREEFGVSSRPLFDPDGLLHLTLGRAHDAVVALGLTLPAEVRPRATCAVCLVQGQSAFWAHIGDSRVYQLRGGRVLERTRDHTHVEQLLRAGRITEGQAHEHPMRNFVESCLGGDPALPEMTLGGRRTLRPGDVLLLCSDGLWSGVTDDDIVSLCDSRERSLAEGLAELGARAVQANAPFADNTSAAAMRWLGA